MLSVIVVFLTLAHVQSIQILTQWSQDSLRKLERKNHSGKKNMAASNSTKKIENSQIHIIAKKKWCWCVPFWVRYRHPCARPKARVTPNCTCYMYVIFSLLIFLPCVRFFIVRCFQCRFALCLLKLYTANLTCWQDRDSNGYVDVDELTNLHSTTKERLTMLEAKTILQVRIQVALFLFNSFSTAVAQ